MLNNRIIYLLTWAVAVFIKVYLCLASNYSESKSLLLPINMYLSATSWEWQWLLTWIPFLPWEPGGRFQWEYSQSEECTSKSFISRQQKRLWSIAVPTRPVTLLLIGIELRQTWELFGKVREEKHHCFSLLWGKGQQGISCFQLMMTLHLCSCC